MRSSRSERRDATRRIGLGAIGVVSVVAIWELLVRGPLAGAPVPTFIDTAVAAFWLLGDQAFWESTLLTITISIGGLVLSVLLGVTIGLLVATSAWLRAGTRVIIEFVKPIPPIVVLPLVVLLFGPSPTMAIVLILIGCVITVVMQTVAGVRETDPVTVDSARSYGLDRVEVLRAVVLPSATPYVGMAIRICAPVSLLVTVVAGLLGGAPGLGSSIRFAQAAGAGMRPELFALVLVLGVLGLGFQGVTAAAERRILHWHPAYRPGVTA